jgi:predicted ferric reductase
VSATETGVNGPGRLLWPLIMPWRRSPPAEQRSPPLQLARRVALIGLYLLVSVGPLSFMVVGSLPPKRPFLVELSVALGFLGLSLMGLQFVLAGRVRAARAFGIDVLVRFHRQVSFLGLGFILAHPILLILDDARRYLPLLVVGSAPWRARFAVASVALTLVLIGLSVWRRRLHVPYDVWQISHGLLAVAVVATALAHINGVGYYTQGPVRTVLFDLVAASMIGMLGWTRVFRPLTVRGARWRVDAVRPEHADTVTVHLEPAGHPGFSFVPGQFVWLGRLPLSFAQRPYSISSPSEGESARQLTITVKSLGRWSRGIASLPRGRFVYLDGPHGRFSIDFHQAPGYVFIAGGVGVTPFYSMLGTMCVRGDLRPATLLYANRDWESILFREELQELAFYMPNLQVVHVLQRPPEGWDGEVGRITRELVVRHLPLDRRFHYFVCGPDGLMDAAEQTLGRLGLPVDHVHSERLGLV